MAESLNKQADASQPKPLSLRLQVALLLAFATLPVGVLAVAQGYASFSDTQRLQRASLASDAFKESAREQGMIREAFGVLDALNSQIDPSMPPDECSAQMRRFVTAHSQVSFAGMGGEDGFMRCGYPLSDPFDLRGTPEYERFIDHPRRTVTVYQKGAISKVPVVTISIPMMREGRLVGSLSLSLPSVYMVWANAPERHSTSHFAILDAEGKTVAWEEGVAKGGWLPDAEGLSDLLRRSGGPIVATAASGEERIYSITPLFERDIFAVSSWSEDQVTGRFTLPQMLLLLLPLIMWALAVTVAYFAVDRFALRHVVYLDRLVSAYARSGRSLRASGMRDAPLEFAALGESFDTMAQEIESRENDLRRSLDEKDALLKEVYHRVRNNLQMIVSLMNLQLREVTGEQERETLLRLQDRVLGLSAVHKRLSEAEWADAIRLDTVLQEIVGISQSGRDQRPGTVTVTFDMIEHVEGPDRSIPLALFTTEAVANAFKHGLGPEGDGWLRVALRDAGDGMLELSVANALIRQTHAPGRIGLGTQLIDSFAMQLHGRIERESTEDDHTIRLFFPRVDCPSTSPLS